MEATQYRLKEDLLLKPGLRFYDTNVVIESMFIKIWMYYNLCSNNTVFVFFLNMRPSWANRYLNLTNGRPFTAMSRSDNRVLIKYAPTTKFSIQFQMSKPLPALDAC